MFCCVVIGVSYLNIYQNKFYNTPADHNEMHITRQVLVSVQTNISEKD
jgi:uncharacterized membrane protein